MTLLVADIGNTQIKLGCFGQDRLVKLLRLSVNQDEPQAFVSTVQSALEVFPLPDALVYCSVVPRLNLRLQEVVVQCFPGLRESVYEATPYHQQERAIDIGQYPPERLGADRWVNLYGAESLYPNTDRIIIDFGTATTIDLLDKERQFSGGVIIPGFETINQILSRKTASLPPLEALVQPPELVGRNTQECLLSGSYFGYLGMLREILDRLARDYPTRNWHILATGGLAERLAALYHSELKIHAVHSELTLLGLHTLYSLYPQELTLARPVGVSG